MANNTPTLSGRYTILSKVDSTFGQSPATHMAARGYHVSYYVVAIACVMFALYWVQFKRQEMPLDIPLYKAARTRWMFDAENAVRDSYNKARRPPFLITAWC